MIATDSPSVADVAALVDAIDPAAEIRYRQALAWEAALAQRERSWSEGHLVVHCQAPGCRLAWYQPRHERR